MSNASSRLKIWDSTFRLYQHIIHVDFHVPSDLCLEHFVNHPLIGRSCILKSERYYFIAIQRSINNEARVFLVFESHPNLVVAQEGIHRSEELVPRGGIYLLINAGNQIAVLQTNLVQISEVNTHPSLPVGLFHQHYIGKPLWVMDFPDEVGLQ